MALPIVTLTPWRDLMRTATTALTTVLAATLIAGCSAGADESNPKYGLKFAAAGCRTLTSDETLFKSTDPARSAATRTSTEPRPSRPHTPPS
ncbi:hypothetical protein OHA88_39390 [Streptomyces sp. NBC_00353]|uniref:hypothetical protein n=1 Tax=Streptomyces sp. NBC_00353 TaxID=2975722 RepID=UPI002E26A342